MIERKDSTVHTTSDDPQHLEALDRAASALGTVVVQDAAMSMLDGSVLYSLAEKDRKYSNYIFGTDWQYAEVAFVAQHRGLPGLFSKQTVNYSVMAVQLPRILPNVLFDSLKHQRQQFRVIFADKQLIQLEGNFDAYFATYFGAEYMIDSLSFITPEVMEALIDADDYDIEIVNNRLLIFGLIDDNPATQLDKMRHSLYTIRNKLLHNIVTYRDERLPYDQGRITVDRSGRFLAIRGGNFFILVLLMGIGGTIIIWALKVIIYTVTTTLFGT